MSRTDGLKQKYELSEEEKHFTALERFEHALKEATQPAHINLECDEHVGATNRIH